MAAKRPDAFTGDMSDWESVETKSPYAADSANRPRSKPNRVAKEQRVVVDTYYSDGAPNTGAKRAGNPHVDGAVEHSRLVRAKKKGTLDNDVNEKTFVVSSGNKIIGSQG